MDYADVFDRQGRLMDDMLLQAFGVTPEQFTAAGPEGAPSLRDLVVEWMETQRRAVHGALLGRPYTPLPSAVTATVTGAAQAFGGFRLTLLETLEATFREDLSRKVTWTAADGSPRDSTVDEVLAHLSFHGARMLGLVAQRLRQLGKVPPAVDLLT